MLMKTKTLSECQQNGLHQADEGQNTKNPEQNGLHQVIEDDLVPLGIKYVISEPKIHRK
ncbi:hypothetical protein [Neobacillus bataviensis]|uniref:hypothetical protein n=1 Tax=Neobacillus bataviensis TaxID=220685 RepID=UPI0012FA7D3E|nr:hypothetical protein [Neobacillus bataviensis]